MVPDIDSPSAPVICTSSPLTVPLSHTSNFWPSQTYAIASPRSTTTDKPIPAVLVRPENTPSTDGVGVGVGVGVVTDADDDASDCEPDEADGGAPDVPGRTVSRTAATMRIATRTTAPAA